MIPPAPEGSVRFNPPPEWAVPEGFDPRQGHLADPTWPTPSSDWPFWLPDTTAAPHRGLRRSEMVRLVATLGVVVLAVVLMVTQIEGDPPTGVGSCWTGAEGGSMEPVHCRSSRATHTVESRVSNPSLCPATSGGYFEDGDGYLCVRRLG